MITDFKGLNYFLHNDYPCAVEYGGIAYPTVSHAMLAINRNSKAELMALSRCKFPSQARQMVRKMTKVKVTETQKLESLQRLVSSKFTNSSNMQRKLLGTSGEVLQFENSGKDIFLGVYNGVGENHLGAILMDVRKKLQRDVYRDE